MGFTSEEWWFDAQNVQVIPEDHLASCSFDTGE
jgi:hypothetical protein